MKKLLYGILTLAAIAGIVLAFFIPVYHFDDKLIEQNYEEYALYVVDSSFEDLRSAKVYNSLNANEKKAYKESYKNAMIAMRSIINGDKEDYYDSFKYQILNDIYLELHPGAEEKLNKDSTDETCKAIEAVIIDDIGQDAFDTKKEYYIETEISTNQQSVYTAILDAYADDYSTLSSEEIKEKALEHVKKDCKYLILNDLLLLFVDSDTELTLLTIEDIETKGLKLTTLFTAWKYAIQIDKQVYNKAEYADLKLFARLKATNNDADYYNLVPLGLFTLVIVLIELSLVMLIFKGIKGARGVKKPKTFFFCIFNAALCALLIFIQLIAPDSYMISYHSVEMTRLLDLFRFGTFDTLIYVYAGIFLYGIVVSALCISGWGKKNKEKD